MRFVIFLVNFVTGIAEAILGIRLVLKLLGANRAAPFVQWIYDMSQPLLRPFLGIFPSPVLDRIYVLEFTTLFAILIYALFGYFLDELLRYLSYRLNLKPPRP